MAETGLASARTEGLPLCAPLHEGPAGTLKRMQFEVRPVNSTSSDETRITSNDEEISCCALQCRALQCRVSACMWC